MRRFSILFAAVLLAGVMAGGAVGVIVGASTVPQIHACAQKTTLLMRFTTGTSCKSGEKLVTWNVAGVAGPKGATGATGAAGATGATGQQGPAGPGGGNSGQTFYVGDNGQVIGLLAPDTMATLKVPAGSYLISLVNQLSTLPRCILTTNINADPTVPSAASLEGYQAFGSPTVLYARCYFPGPAATAVHMQIIASVATKLSSVP